MAQQFDAQHPGIGFAWLKLLRAGKAPRRLGHVALLLGYLSEQGLSVGGAVASGDCRENLPRFGWLVVLNQRRCIGHLKIAIGRPQRAGRGVCGDSFVILMLGARGLA